MKLTVNAAVVLKKRYLLKDEQGKIIETPKQLFRRVAHVASDSKEQEAEFFSGNDKF